MLRFFSGFFRCFPIVLLLFAVCANGGFVPDAGSDLNVSVAQTLDVADELGDLEDRSGDFVPAHHFQFFARVAVRPSYDDTTVPPCYLPPPDIPPPDRA